MECLNFAFVTNKRYESDSISVEAGEFDSVNEYEVTQSMANWVPDS